MILQNQITWLKKIIYNDKFWDREKKQIISDIDIEFSQNYANVIERTNIKPGSDSTELFIQEGLGPVSFYSDFNYKLVAAWYANFGQVIKQTIEHYKKEGANDIVKLRSQLAKFYITLKTWNNIGDVNKMVETVSTDLRFVEQKLNSLKDDSYNRDSFEVDSYLWILNIFVSVIEQRIEEKIKSISDALDSNDSYIKKEHLKKDTLNVKSALDHLNGIGFDFIFNELAHNSDYLRLVNGLIKRNAGNSKTEIVPQKNIRKFVAEKLTGDSSDRYIHTNNRYGKKGEPIIEKLATAYIEKNPHIKKHISKRRLKDRMEEACNSLKHNIKVT